jgi:hypothetical protein
MADSTIDGNLRLSGNLILTDPTKSISSGVPRSWLTQDDNKVYSIPLTECFVWDSGAKLPTSASADDLAHITGTFGTSTDYISAGDCKALGATTRRCRFRIVLPPEYVGGQTVSLRVAAGMLTTVADTSCTVDFEAYKVNRDTLVSGGDLVTTAATTMNSLTFSEKTFAVTSGALVAGDILDVRMTIVCTDAATGTAVTPAVAAIDLVCDIKG